eukprot:gene29115-biopygen32986
MPSSQELLPKVPFQDFFGQRTIGMVRVSTAPLAPLGTAAAHALYQDGLSRAAQVTDPSVVASTLAKRYAVGQALEAWLARLPPPFPQSLLAACPEDVLCFMQQHWVLHHGRSVVAGVDHPVASPQGVAGSLSHLSTLFDTLGRSGPYNALTSTGNPCDSPAVRAYKRGYQQILWQAGYQEVAAVPMVESKVLALMAYLHQMARTARTVVKAISFFRDALLVEHAWLTAYRGKEGGMLCLPDLHHADLTPIFPDGYSPGVGIVPHLVTIPTHGTKTNRRGRAYQAPVYFHQKPGDPVHYFVAHLWAYLQLCDLAGHPISHFLFRPALPTSRGFKEAPYSSSCFTKLIKRHLKALDMYGGETSHSFRRGTLQATAATSGRQAAALHGGIKTARVVSLYLHPTRHLGRVSPPSPV